MKMQKKRVFFAFKLSHRAFISQLIPPKQHTRRLPPDSMSQAFSILLMRVFASLPVMIQKIQSRRAMGVISSQITLAFGVAVRALARSVGTLVSISSPRRVRCSETSAAAWSPVFW